MKRVHFPAAEENLKSVDPPLPQFISPRKILRTTNQRKRSISFSFENGSKQHHFKRRRTSRQEEFVRTTKFLLGGNSRDPLNLGSLADEKINRALNEHTPESSPLPTPKHRKEEIEVLIPPNIRDPLNLSIPNDDLAERALISPNAVSRKKKGRSRKRRRTNSAGEVLDTGRKDTEIETNIQDLISPPKKSETTASNLEETPKKVENGALASGCVRVDLKELKLKLDSNSNRHASRRAEDKIVSPVVPQPGARKIRNMKNQQNQRQLTRANSKEPCSCKAHPSTTTTAAATTTTTVKEVKRFQYGNYDRYYGYRNPNCEDVRLLSFRPDWFAGLDVLDIGCNAGHVTMSVAHDFNPRKIVGIDIDPKLIASARKSVKSYAKAKMAEHGQFPMSLPLIYGAIPPAAPSTFPNNVSFVQGNYVPESEEFLQMVTPEYDTVLCLSVTKWIHLNWKDAGLKRFFRRIFSHLRPGGRLILEAQGWASYNRRKKLTEEIAENYAAIQLYPERFGDFLLSQVGFSTCEEVVTAHHSAKGFRRPIHIYTKAQSPPATPSIHDSNVEAT